MIYCEQMCNNLLTDMQNTNYAKPSSRAYRRPAAKVRAVHYALPRSIPLLSLQCHWFLAALEHKAKALLEKVWNKGQRMEEHNSVGHAKGAANAPEMLQHTAPLLSLLLLSLGFHPTPRLCFCATG